MTLRLPDKWIWDFWFAHDGPDTHMFYLQAPRSLPHPEQRHWNVSIGHAVSQDLKTWQVLPDALHPNPIPAWDDYTTWTGSVIKHTGLWYMFYTGSNHAEKGLVQRVGLATSTDLLTWTKHPKNPIIEADPHWYELLDQTLWHDQAWRDPWVFHHPQTGDFHVFITARANHGPADGRGVIAHARSANLLDWEVLPPVTEPGEFGQLEVPQLAHIQDRYYLLFSTLVKTHAQQRIRRPGVTAITGTHYLVANDPLGPFTYTTDNFLVGDAPGTLYSGKLVQNGNGNWTLMAFRNYTTDGHFMGDIISPRPVTVDASGNLVVLEE